MARNPNQELVWQGRIHLGDEPGIYGDAQYAGLSAELPFTVHRAGGAPADGSFRVVVETDGVATYPGYDGHAVSVVCYETDPDPNKPYHSVERVLVRGERLVTADGDRKEVVVSPGKAEYPLRISVRVRVDTTANPAFYDDFVWVRLSLLSADHSFYASFGFPDLSPPATPG